jgi:hypothetical protein
MLFSLDVSDRLSENNVCKEWQDYQRTIYKKHTGMLHYKLYYKQNVYRIWHCPSVIVKMVPTVAAMHRYLPVTGTLNNSEVMRRDDMYSKILSKSCSGVVS